MVIGFSGTADGMTDAQRHQVVKLLERLHPDTIIHGDCVGADEQFHILAVEAGVRGYIILPGHDILGASPKRAFCQIPDGGVGVIERSQPYLARNNTLAQMCSRLIAAPESAVEQFRGSGTWATVRYARAADKPVHLITPDGKVLGDRF